MEGEKSWIVDICSTQSVVFDTSYVETGLNGLIKSEFGKSLLISSCPSLLSSTISSNVSKNSASWLKKKSILDRD